MRLLLLLQVPRVGEVVDASAEEGLDWRPEVEGDGLGRKGAHTCSCGGCCGVGAWVPVRVGSDDGQHAKVEGSPARRPGSVGFIIDEASHILCLDVEGMSNLYVPKRANAIVAMK